MAPVQLGERFGVGPRSPDQLGIGPHTLSMPLQRIVFRGSAE
jgi:hypothetical protein